MKFKYVGGSPKIVLGKVVQKGDVIDLPDNFKRDMFEEVSGVNDKKKIKKVEEDKQDE